MPLLVSSNWMRFSFSDPLQLAIFITKRYRWPPFSWRGLFATALMGILYLVLIIFRVSLVSFSEAALKVYSVWQWTSWAYDKLGLIVPATVTLLIDTSL